MSVFFITTALLVLAAILFVIPPLLKRETGQPSADRRALNISIYQDQLAELERDLANDVITREQYVQSRQELEHRLLEDVADVEDKPLVSQGLSRATALSAVLMAALIPLLAAGIYLELGTPSAVAPIPGRAQSPAPAGSEMQDQINEMVQRLEQRLADNPNDAEGWAMLGRSYLALERFDQALAALEKAVGFNSNDAQLLVDYADALAMTGGKTLEGRPMELIGRALALDPDNQKALWLAGTAEYERTNFEQALVHWRRLYALVPKGSDAARSMESNIAETEALLAGAEPVPPPRAEAAVPGAARTIKGTVKIDSALRGRVEPTDTVFIFARAVEGPRLPLAVMRAQVKDLPMEYTLDDSMAMDPAVSLSKFSEVVVVARVSKTGGAMVQSGDLQGMSAVVRTAASQPVQVVISEVVP